MRYSEAHSEDSTFLLWRESIDLPVVARFTVDGEPVSKARARFTKRGSRTHTYTPQRTLDAERSVAAKFRAAAPAHKVNARDKYGVTAIFFQSTKQRRDVDNMLKLICDGLNGVAYKDDSQVVEVSGRKMYDPLPECARTEVIVYRAVDTEGISSCARCGKEFQTYPSIGQKYCSTKCAYAHRAEKAPPMPPCAVCEQPVKSRKAATCSTECGGKYRASRIKLKTHCKRGHEYTPENTRVWRNQRSCRKCQSDADKRRRERAS